MQTVDFPTPLCVLYMSCRKVAPRRHCVSQISSGCYWKMPL